MKQRLQKLITHLQQGLIERDEPARLALLAALAGEHLLLLGPPGTAKSELAKRLKLVFREGNYFERLLTKFSVPEELFGPLSIKALEQDRYERLTHCYLPSASIAFIDEIFKANSAILNALLTLLNEREFDNGARRVKTPLIAVIGASNELPEGDDLEALYDRFLIRYQVKSVSDQGFDALLALKQVNEPTIPQTLQLSFEDVHAIQERAQSLPLSNDVQYLIKQLRQFLREQSVYVSDRRWRKLVNLLKVAAYTNGQDQVTEWDCWLMQHCLWQLPEQRDMIFHWYQGRLGTDAVINPQRLTRLADAWEQTLAEESHKTRQLKNEYGERLYLDEQQKVTTCPGRKYQAYAKGEPLYLAPPDQSDRSNQNQGYTRQELQQRFFDDHYQQCHIDGKWVGLEEYTRCEENWFMHYDQYQPCEEPVLYSEQHIKDRVEEAQSLLDTINQYTGEVKRKIETLEDEVQKHLWLVKEFARPAKENSQRSLQVVTSLAQRIATIRDGFAALPRIAESG